MPQKDVAASFTNYLRKASKLSCPFPGCEDQFPAINDRIQNHLQSRHQDLLEQKDVSLFIREVRTGSTVATRRDPSPPAEEDSESLKLIKQPETRPISQEQLITEVKGIYAGLVMVEHKCIEVDNAQLTQNETKLNNETLLHEHHDFFLASQHPSASQVLRRLASKYAMPARIWRHECLGDLGRYRMAIEDNDIQDREVWTSVSRYWYSKASNKTPTTGRLYHHLAILAQPDPLQQLYYYIKSLCMPIPFSSTRESIMTLFDPILDPTNIQHSRLITIDVAFVKAHGILFSNKYTDDFLPTVDKFCSMLDNYIGRTTRKWMESGYYIAVSNCCALLSYGQEDNILLKGFHPHVEDIAELITENSLALYKPSRTEEGALRLFEGTCDVTLPFLHVIMVFIFHLTYYLSAMSFIEKTIPWKLISLQLNSLLLSCREHHKIHDEQFPRQDKELAPHKYFPVDWFSNDKIDNDEKYFEVTSMTDDRKERILWLACRITKLGKWLTYDETLHQFGIVPEYEKEIGAMLVSGNEGPDCIV
ncbi:uncharacterized protein F4822DRAFT_441809 [Hypoxylon trugodes]|uniref:uncharacterized protein n=1 Tax=Hypoxylon trugodes TaxID=326681 RepID=UPI002191B26A|nr:uncharacterized protein F4822DRAFT_441809 [Hypoxylon trugodes]KAI1382569.1 hypothetical protein F4822DRAFT_441809 [Hypoxylon trugodes]